MATALASMQATVPVDHVLDLTLHPRHLGKPADGLRVQVRKMLNLYSPRLDGVPVAARRIRLLHGLQGSIFEEMPTVHVRAVVSFDVFRPAAGQLLEGAVNTVTPSHVGLLVNQRFNAKVAHESLPAGYAHDAEQEAFVFESMPQRAIMVGSRLLFLVKVLETSTHGAINLVGSALEPGTGVQETRPTSTGPPRVASALQSGVAAPATGAATASTAEKVAKASSKRTSEEARSGGDGIKKLKKKP